MSEPDVSNLLSVAEAIAIIDAANVRPRVLRRQLDGSMGLRLAQEIVADRDYPPFDKSLMDGFALRCEDVTGRTGPIELSVVGTVAAGHSRSEPLKRGEAVAIMTGAPLPPGADGIVPVEATSRPSDQRVRIEQAQHITTGRFIARRGSDCAAGRPVLSRGARLEAAALAVAASVGAAEVDVFDRPKVAVMTTGDEIVAVEAMPAPAQIRNSSLIMLTSLLRRFDCEVSNRGIVRDDPAVIREALASAIDSSDVTFVTGGMSMGEFDYVPRVLMDLGVELKVTKLRIKPGKPFVFGIVRRPSSDAPRFVFGLPGNPVSAYVCTLRLCRRLLTRLAGGVASDGQNWVTGTLSAALPPNGPREFYQPAKIDERGAVTPLPWKGSADIYTLAVANGLLVRAENEPALRLGATVRVLEVPS